MLGLFQPKDRLIVHGEAPYNAEPPLDRLRAAFLTDQADFYVRSHGDIPDLDADGYRLTVDGMIATPLELSVADLKARFAHVTVTAVMQCAGNRRADMLAVAPVAGDPWAAGAIGSRPGPADRLCVSTGPIRTESGRRDRAGLRAMNSPRPRSRKLSAWRRSMPSRSA